MQTSDHRPKGLQVIVKNGNIDKAFRKLNKKVADDGILVDYKEKQYYEKPSDKRKKAKAAGRAREQLKLKRRLEEYGF